MGSVRVIEDFVDREVVDGECLRYLCWHYGSGDVEV